MPYSNVTLSSLDGDLSVVVYLPIGINENNNKKDEELPVFYHSSRFDHGSMIGSITRKRRFTQNILQDDGSVISKEQVTKHVLYGTDTWRVPHNAQWPESGVGLASEFGVGDDGATCYFRCGWNEATDVTNGVLGYQEVANGEAFLKIGVGELIKGSCPSCDSTDDYRFNSPYLFAKEPQWKMTHVAKNSHDENTFVQLEHEARLRNHGYSLIKGISLNDNVLSVTMTLQNLGTEPFSTVWYSHNFFSCDGIAVGPGYALDMNLKGASVNPVYSEPSTWTWSTPLDQFGKVEAFDNSVHLEMTRALDPGTRIKTEFTNDHETNGAFTLLACDTSIEATIESPDMGTILSMYAYNLYVERGTFSPEPQLLIRNLQPGQSTTWTLNLVISDDGDAMQKRTHPSSTTTFAVRNFIPDQHAPWWNLRGMMYPKTQETTSLLSSPSSSLEVSEDGTAESQILAVVGCCIIVVVLILTTWSRYRRRRQYDTL